MDAVTLISTSMSSLLAIKDLATAAVDLRDSQKLAAVKLDLTERVLQTQTQLSQVLSSIIEKDTSLATLAQRVRELEDRQLERARYELGELAAGGNAFAYRLKAPARLLENSHEPQHFVCQPCFDAGKKAILFRRDVWGTWVWTCPLCKLEIHGDRVAGR